MSKTAPTEIDLIDLSLLAKVDLFIDFVFGGRHHTKRIIEHSNCFEVLFWQGVSTWDGNIMTKIVVASHDLGLRASLDANGMQGLKLTLHSRATRAASMTGHPTLEQHLEKIGRVT